MSWRGVPRSAVCTDRRQRDGDDGPDAEVVVELVEWVAGVGAHPVEGGGDGDGLTPREWPITAIRSVSTLP